MVGKYNTFTVYYDEEFENEFKLFEQLIELDGALKIKSGATIEDIDGKTLSKIANVKVYGLRSACFRQLVMMYNASKKQMLEKLNSTYDAKTNKIIN